MFNEKVIDEYARDYVLLTNAAKKQKQVLEIGEDVPVAGYLEMLLEKKGIVLLKKNFTENGRKTLGGMLMEVHNGVNTDYYIGINTNDYLDKQKFSIAHEIYHYAARTDSSLNEGNRPEIPHISREGADDPEENRADLFAAEFLLPLDTLKRLISVENGMNDLSYLPDSQVLRFVAKLHCDWQMPYKSIIRRLREAGALSVESYKKYYAVDERDTKGEYYSIGLATNSEVFKQLNRKTNVSGTDLKNLENLIYNYEHQILDEEELIEDLKLFDQEPEQVGIHFEIGEADEDEN